MARATHLSAALLGAEAEGAPGTPIALRVDQVLLDARAGTVALAGAAATPAAARPQLWVVPEREDAGPVGQRELAILHAATTTLGARVARPGAAPAAALHLRASAAPGEVLVSPLPEAAGAGAYGMLVIRAAVVECAAWAVGVAVPWLRPPVLGVALEGEWTAGVGGIALARAIADHAGNALAGAVIECHGPAVAALPLAARIACCRTLAARGAVAVVFPADAAVRAAMRAAGREDGWRRFEGGARGFDQSVTLDAGEVAPEVVPLARALRVGPYAEDDTLRVLAHALAAAPAAAAGVEVVLGGRVQREVLEADGTLARLRAGGARVFEPQVHERLDAGTCTVDGEHDAPAATDLAPALAAVLGLADPGAAAALADGARLERGAPIPEGEWLPRATMVEPAPPAWRVLPPWRGRRRAVVLAAVAAGTRAAEVLPTGPRTEAVRHDPGAVASLVLRDRHPEVAARARDHGGGVLVAGAGLGEGADAENAARALAALGVEAVLAEGFADGWARLLALHGVQPLRWDGDSAPRVPPPGTELEWVASTEALDAGGAVAVRDLTRGLTLGARAAVPPPLMALARTGGLPARMCATPTPLPARILP